MNIKKPPFWQPLLIFNALWAIYYLFSLIRGDMPDGYYKLINLLPFLFFSLVAAGLFLATSGGIRRLTRHTFLLLPFFLILLDQVLKAMVRQYFTPGPQSDLHLLFRWLYFRPRLNTRGSWAAHLFNLNWPFLIYTLFNILVLPLLIIGYRFHVYKRGHSAWIDLFLLLFIAGLCCSLIDKLVFGGSLDYLALHNMFVADLKDFYLTFGTALLFTEWVVRGDGIISPRKGWQQEWRLLQELWAYTFKRGVKGSKRGVRLKKERDFPQPGRK